METKCELDLGTWLAAAEARCERAGRIRNRIERESQRVLKLMNERESKKGKGNHTLPVGEITESEELQAGWKNIPVSNAIGGTGNHAPTVGGAQNLPGGWTGEDGMKAKKQNKTSQNHSYNLVGLVGFWRRWERKEKIFLMEGTKKETKKREEKVARGTFVHSIINRIKPTTTVTEEEEYSSSTTYQSGVQVKSQTANIRVGQKRKNDIFVTGEQFGSPVKTRKLNNFEIARIFWVGKEGSAEDKQSGPTANQNTSGENQPIARRDQLIVEKNGILKVKGVDFNKEVAGCRRLPVSKNYEV